MHQPLSQGLHNVIHAPVNLQSKRACTRAHTHTRTHILKTHACAHGKFEVVVVLIVPSSHMPWWSAEGALFWELDIMLFWDAIHRRILRRMLKKLFNVQG
jgi:hypothetical protein